MKVSQSTDLTVGKPAVIILRFAFPLILANLFQQLYNTVDTVIVGKFNGDDALAAVGASFAVTMVMIAFATGTGTGCSVLISRQFGKKDISGFKTSVSTILIFSLFLSIFIGIIGIAFSGSLLKLLKTPENIISDASGYLMIYSAGMPFMFLYSVQSSVFSSFGNSKTPMLLLIMSSLINILLDILLVGHLSMGVMGAAAATTAAQAFSCIISLIILLKYLYGSLFKEYAYKYFSFSALREIISYSAVSITQNSVTSIGMLIIQALVNRFGSGVLAGYTAASKIDSFAIMPYLACSNAISTYTAQNTGAGKTERISEGHRAGLYLCFAMAGAELLIILLLRVQFLGMFLNMENSSSKAVETGSSYMITMAFCYWIMGINSCQNGILRGKGRLKILFANSIIGLAVRIGFAYIFVRIIGVSAVWLSMPVGWIFSILFFYLSEII